MLGWFLSLLGSLIPAIVKGWFKKDAAEEKGQLEVKVKEQAEVLQNAKDAKNISGLVDGLDADALERMRQCLNTRRD